MNTTRERAWQGLNAILNEGQYANLWLRQHGQTLSEEEKRWVTAVIYGVLRHREPLRWQWRDLVRNVPEPSVAVLLDMSVYQLFYLDKGAEYAIVNDAVELCPRSKKGLVNAVLRQLLRRGPKPLPEPESIADLALVTRSGCCSCGKPTMAKKKCAGSRWQTWKKRRSACGSIR